MFSVIIPLYNKAATIERSIKSVLNQSFQEFELIVIDDGSSDNSYDIVKEIKDSRIKIVRQKNSGVSVARNHGLALAKQEFVAFLDADDIWDIDYLETQKDLIIRFRDCHVFATNYRFLSQGGKSSPTILNNISFDEKYGILDNYFTVASTSHVPVCTIAVVIRKDSLEEIGGFPQGIKSGEDLLTWARLAVIHKIAYCILPKASYCLGEGYDYSNEPPRRQDPGDPVGKELRRLFKIYKKSKNCSGFKDYLSHWHKMRASVAIRFGESWETLIESSKALYFNPLNYKVIPFILLAVIPPFIRKKIINLKNTN